MHVSDRPVVSIVGAGLIGCYVGGVLAAGGANIRLIGRPAFLDPIRKTGLRVTDFQGRDDHVAAGTIILSERPDAVADSDAILVAVKSDASAAAARGIAPFLKPATPILSLQNGVENVATIASALPGTTVFPGMVPFNVAMRSPGHFHQGTGSAIYIDADPALDPVAAEFDHGHLPIRRSADMPGILWGKLIVNLNNAINALSGVPLAAELANRDYRRAWALCMREGLHLLRAAGIRPADVLPLPIRHLPTLVSLPDFLYRRIMARQKTTIDRHARSSMADDLARGKPTEVDHLNGTLVRLAAQLGARAPVNTQIIKLVRAAEAGAAPIAGRELRQLLSAASTRA